MSHLLKDLYSPDFYQNFLNAFQKVSPKVDREAFLSSIFDEQWEQRELKDRMRHTTKTMHQWMPTHFKKAVALMKKLLKVLENEGIQETSVEYMFLPDYLELYGLEHCKTSLAAMEWLTPFTSCEFAIRPFIVRYPEILIPQILAWTTHSDLHLRRLASEGCRPRLPWAMALPELKKDPSPILPILAQLKNDPSEYVRKSVANNLNDISKDHPELVLRIGREWKGRSKATDWIIKHACRTLLKAGNKTAMQLFGYSPTDQLQVHQFDLQAKEVRIGETLNFSFQMTNSAPQEALLRIEYGIDYLRANGSLSRKVFKITERKLAAGARLKMERKQSFRIITTKTFYPGRHQLALIVNGEEMGCLSFELLPK
ncbi:MAG: DNA alkylation repair protein [Bacteroidota bacterium]